MAQQSKSENLIIPISQYLSQKTEYKTGTSDRAVVRFSNLRVLIVIDCLAISLSVLCCKTLNSGGS